MAPGSAVENPHALPASEVLARLGSDVRSGLTTVEAAARLRQYGPNELPTAPPAPRWRRFLAQLQSPLVLLLLGAAVVSLGVWWHEGGGRAPYEALAILAIVVANAVLGAMQEERAERALASLKRMSAATALILRDGERVSVPAAGIVPGDLLAIEEGATIPADARLVQSVSLQTVEGALTGESAPVAKDVEVIPAGAPLPDRTDMVFAGTTAAAGRGLAVVTATGANAEIGRIARLLAATESPPTPLQRQLAVVGRVLGAVVIAIAVVVGATILTLQQDFSAAALVAVLLYAIALAVAAVPEGLAAVTTVVLSLGTQRMAKRNAIVRTLAAVETLGAATVICTDKTGTLTRNEMTVRALVTAGGTVELTGTGYAPAGELRTGGPAQRAEAAAALTVACLCNNASVVERDGRWLVVGDPTEGALQVAATKAALDRAALAARFERVGEIPFSAERKLMSTIHRDRDGAVTLMTKGAPDVLLARCVRERVGGAERALTAERRAAIRAEVDRFAGDALRTLGVASCPVPAGAPLPARPEDERDLVWLGLVGMIDPPRPEAADAVRTAHAAGVRVVMITGDHPATAAAIAAELGIAARGDAVESGADLERMSDAALAASAARTNVYARVSPEHKLAIVRALHAGGQVVAMTGDGVNDAPALKAADIGIAMGITGTDVAKDAADIVLADDNFASIVAAIEEGRSIYSNIQKFLRYLLSANLGEVLVMFFGVVLAGLIGLGAAGGAGLVLPLLAVQILWVNLVTDSLPALAVGIDPPEPALMRRAPRDPKIGVITPRMWAGICVAAIVIAAGTLAALDAGLPGGLLPGSGPVEYARTLAFTTLVLFELYDVFCARSDEETTLHRTFRNGWLLAAVAIGLALQLAVVYTPSLQQAFGTVPLAAADWAFCAAIAASIVLWREAGKAWWRGVDRWRSAPAAAASAVR